MSEAEKSHGTPPNSKGTLALYESRGAAIRIFASHGLADEAIRILQDAGLPASLVPMLRQRDYPFSEIRFAPFPPIDVSRVARLLEKHGIQSDVRVENV